MEDKKVKETEMRAASEREDVSKVKTQGKKYTRVIETEKER